MIIDATKEWSFIRDILDVEFRYWPAAKNLEKIKAKCKAGSSIFIPRFTQGNCAWISAVAKSALTKEAPHLRLSVQGLVQFPHQTDSRSPARFLGRKIEATPVMDHNRNHLGPAVFLSKFERYTNGGGLYLTCDNYDVEWDVDVRYGTVLSKELDTLESLQIGESD